MLSRCSLGNSVGNLNSKNGVKRWLNFPTKISRLWPAPLILEIQEPELTHVAYSLNAILEAMDNIDIPCLNAVEPLPIILPERSVGT